MPRIVGVQLSGHNCHFDLLNENLRFASVWLRVGTVIRFASNFLTLISCHCFEDMQHSQCHWIQCEGVCWICWLMETVSDSEPRDVAGKTRGGLYSQYAQPARNGFRLIMIAKHNRSSTYVSRCTLGGYVSMTVLLFDQDWDIVDGFQ